MHHPEEKICPRCQAAFTCNSSDIARCVCREIPLREATIRSLEKDYAGCLCTKCLAELNRTGEAT